MYNHLTIFATRPAARAIHSGPRPRRQDPHKAQALPRPPVSDEQKRAKNRARVARFKARNPKRFAEIQATYDAKRDPNKKNDRQREQRFRLRKTTPTLFQEYLGFRVAHARQLDRPPLIWMDTNGDLHHEKELSAEELIRRWQREEKRRGKKATEEEAPQTTPSH